MSKKLDITNQHFGRLVAIRPVNKNIWGSIFWLCQCDCSNFHTVSVSNLKNGNIKSCGCIRKEGFRFAHGYATNGRRNPHYRIWSGIHERCGNPNNKSYKNYGGRGIRVDPRWNDFRNFLADVGERPHPDLSLDRIDNDGHYTPGNVRWATRSEQNKNRRSSRAPLDQFSTTELEAELLRRKRNSSTYKKLPMHKRNSN
jgi:hypothetical protein